MSVFASKTIKQAVISLVAVAIISGIGWIFCQVRNLPAVYAQSAVVKEEMLQVKCDITNRLDRLESYLDKRITKLEDKFDTIILNLAYLQEMQSSINCAEEVGGVDSVLNKNRYVSNK